MKGFNIKVHVIMEDGGEFFCDEAVPEKAGWLQLYDLDIDDTPIKKERVSRLDILKITWAPIVGDG